jgi:hypothetical protein
MTITETEYVVRQAALAERRRQREARDREVAARIARFITSCGRDQYGDWDNCLAEISETFPPASLRSFLWATELVS